MRVISRSGTIVGFATFAIAILSVAPAKAQAVMGNLAGSTPLSGSGGFLFSVADRNFAVGGTVGATNLDFISFEAYLQNLTVNTYTLPGGIYGNSGGNPGTLLTSFIPLNIGPGSATYTFTTAAPFTLTAATTYWFVLDGANIGTGSAVRWNTATGNTPSTSTIDMAFAGNRLQMNGGGWGGISTNHLHQVNATPEGNRIPEPGTLALIGIGMMGGLLARHRKA